MSLRVYVVMEGEMAHYFAYIPHAVFSERVTAERYAAALVRGNGAQRWPNCCVVEFELNRPGHIEHSGVALQ